MYQEKFEQSHITPEQARHKLEESAEALKGLPEFSFLSELEDDSGVFVVGGFTRDVVQGNGNGYKKADIDLLVNRVDVDDLLDKLSKHGQVILKKGGEVNRGTIMKNNGVFVFKPDDSDMRFDIAFPRTDDHSRSGGKGAEGIKRDVESRVDPDMDIEEDLKRRNFTFNSMALDIRTGELVDPLGGLDDAMSGKVKTVIDPRESIVKQDMTRGLDAIKRVARPGMHLEANTKKAVAELFTPVESAWRVRFSPDSPEFKSLEKFENETRGLFGVGPEENLPRLLQVYWDGRKPRMAVPREKIGEYIFDALESRPRFTVELLDELGALKYIFGEVSALKGVEQSPDYHSEGDVYKHTLMVLDRLPDDASLRLILAALYHDTGKKDTQTFENDRITFHKHNSVGARLGERLFSRLRLSRVDTDAVSWLIERHMFSISPDRKTIKEEKLLNEFLRDKTLARDLISLSRADIGASIPREGEPDLSPVEEFEKRIEELIESEQRGLGSDIKFTGTDLKRVVPDIQPKRIKPALRAIRIDIGRGNIEKKEDINPEYIQKIIKI